MTEVVPRRADVWFRTREKRNHGAPNWTACEKAIFRFSTPDDGFDQTNDDQKYQSADHAESVESTFCLTDVITVTRRPFFLSHQSLKASSERLAELLILVFDSLCLQM